MLWQKVKEQPVATLGVVEALLWVATEFGVPLSEGQQDSLLGLVGAIGLFLIWHNVEPLALQRKRGKI